MKIRTLAIVGTVVGLATAMPAVADHDDRRGRYARVVDVEPLVRHVVVERPREDCLITTGYRSARPGRVAANALAGGVIGGTIGQAVGGNLGGNGARAALGLIGAAAGSAIAAERSHRRHGDVAVPVETCHVTYERFTEERITGYRVTYRYRGRLHQVRTLDHPGDRIRIEALPRVRRYY